MLDKLWYISMLIILVGMWAINECFPRMSDIERALDLDKEHCIDTQPNIEQA